MSVLTAKSANFVNQRRSQRVMLAIQLEVRGKRHNQSSFTEAAVTIVVNSHGALLALKEQVEVGQALTLKNMRTEEESLCTVVELFHGIGGASEVAVEFTEPNARFWRITFPPSDWSPRSPEAKKFAIGKAGEKAPLQKK